MKKLLLPLLLAAVTSLASCASVQPPARHREAMTATNGHDRVTLYNEPCSSAVILAALTPQLRAVMRDADALVNGKPFRACWVVDGENAHLLYEDGDQGLIPARYFKPDSGV